MLVIGTRGSDLALTQARGIAALLLAQGIETRLEIIKTKGDRIQDLSFDKIEGKGFFTKEIEEALLSKATDIAVHSFKDLPTDSPDSLVIAGIPEREDPRDCLLISRAAYDAKGDALPIARGARVGTGAVRRKAMLRYLRDDLQPMDLRGNVPTRVGRLREGLFDAVVLAQAGLQRLGLELSSEFVVVPLSEELFVPAPAQGALALQCRVDHEEALEALGLLHHADVDRHVKAERTLLARLEGGCHLPLGAHAQAVDGGRMRLLVFFGGSEQQPEPRRLEVVGSDPVAVAQQAYEELVSP